MSMKRVLGMMLASRMAGRGMQGGLGGGGLAGLAAAGLLGGRRGGLGRKASLAALGYMAYRAYSDHQARHGGDAPQRTAESDTGGSGPASGSRENTASQAGLGSALGGIVKSVSDVFTNRQRPADGGAAGRAAGASPEPAFTAEDRREAEAFSEEKARLLLRAMIAAANADGTVSAEERARILAQADEAGADAEDQRNLERELANPWSLDGLIAQVRDQKTAEEFYLASRIALRDSTEASRAYLARLRTRLGLDDQEAAEIDTLAT